MKHVYYAMMLLLLATWSPFSQFFPVSESLVTILIMVSGGFRCEALLGTTPTGSSSISFHLLNFHSHHVDICSSSQDIVDLASLCVSRHDIRKSI